jgi:hypothetical protein
MERKIITILGKRFDVNPTKVLQEENLPIDAKIFLLSIYHWKKDNPETDVNLLTDEIINDYAKNIFLMYPELLDQLSSDAFFDEPIGEIVAEAY